MIWRYTGDLLLHTVFGEHDVTLLRAGGCDIGVGHMIERVDFLQGGLHIYIAQDRIGRVSKFLDNVGDDPVKITMILFAIGTFSLPNNVNIKKYKSSRCFTKWQGEYTLKSFEMCDANTDMLPACIFYDYKTVWEKCKQ
jgi:hypothetical protein